MDLLKMQRLKYHCCISFKECKNDLTAEKYVSVIQTHRTDRAEQNKGMKSQPIMIKLIISKATERISPRHELRSLYNCGL